MKVKELARSPATTCARETTLVEAARMMHRDDVGSVIVTDGDEIVGIVTDRDLAVRGYAREMAPSTAVSELASGHPQTVREGADITDAAKRMMAHGVRRLPVVDDDGRLSGVVSLDDLAMQVEAEGDVLRRAVAAQTRRDSAGWAGSWDE